MGKILRQANGLQEQDNDTAVANITEANALYRKQYQSNSWYNSDDDDCDTEDDDITSLGTVQNQQLHHTEEDEPLPTTSGTLQAHLTTITEDDERESDASYSRPEPSPYEDQSSDDDSCKSPKKKRIRLFKTYPGVKKTWATPERAQVRDLFKEYIRSLDPPTLDEVRTILSGQPHTIDRRADKVRSWIIAEIQRKIKVTSKILAFFMQHLQMVCKLLDEVTWW